MGSGSISLNSYADYSRSVGKSVDFSTGRVTSAQVFRSEHTPERLKPFKKNQEGEKVPVLRECVNSDEHPNTVPVIIGLDVTGSMGKACEETAKALGSILVNLGKEFKDIEFCMMGVGDIECDNEPVQIGQFESDVRIAKDCDDIYMEHHGGGNGYESYTIPWYMGLKHTKLDCYDNQGRKGIIITMGDEPLNPTLPADKLEEFIGDTPEADVETLQLYKDASEKFDIYHISISDEHCSYNNEYHGRYEEKVDNSFKEVIGDHYCVTTIQGLEKTITSLIEKSINGAAAPAATGTPAETVIAETVAPVTQWW